MPELRYRILNVFAATERLSGNPLCVFEDGTGLDATQMQALARQLNLSETTFIFPPESEPEKATAKVRIFTPTFEMPFAGHPTLGTAHVVSALSHGADRVVLDMKAGLVEVIREGDRWTLRTAKAATTREVRASRGALAATLRLGPEAVTGVPLWVDAGVEQLVVPLADANAVRAANADARLMSEHALSESRGEAMAYVWAREGDHVVARFFFLAHGNVVEDPATGSACANLGGWLLAQNTPLPVTVRIHQGDAIGRPSILYLRIDETRQIFVSGAVVELGEGTMRL
jgi:PhzF family phenazine biosynthesis protein